MDERDFMHLALELAARGRGFTSPNPMVGAVVVKDGQVVGRGYHQAAGLAHAEVNALEEAGSSARGATLYVTLEPCNHQGRTPPCTRRVIASGVRRVVVAMEDPNPDVVGGGIAMLREKGLTVDVGLCREEALRLNEAFVRWVRSKRPFVILKCAATLDGRIATRTGDARWVTSEASRAHVHRIRHAVDAIMVGIGTVARDDPSLTTRLPDMGGKDPVRIILDSRLSIPQAARVLHLNSKSDTIIVSGENADPARRDALAAAGARVITVPLNAAGQIDLNALMRRLGAMQVTSLLIEGGARVMASALAARIADKINFFYAPKILGGDDGVPICRGAGPDRMNGCLMLERLEVHRFGPDVMVEGYFADRPA